LKSAQRNKVNDNDAADGGGDGGDYEVHTSILILQSGFTQCLI